LTGDIYSQIKSSGNLPPLPHVVAELMQATLSDKTSISDIAKIIQRDPSLTGYVLKVVNSPFYGLSRKVTTPSQAIVILGLRAVQNISLTASVFQTFHGVKTKGAFSVERFWWHSLACALTNKHLSEEVGYDNSEEAFVAGLLHDIGKLVLYTNFSSDYEIVVKKHREGENLIVTEESFFGTNHADIGGWILDSWNLQPFLVDAVRYHHRPLKRIVTALSLVKTTYLANVLSHAIFETGVETGLGEEAELVSKALGVPLDYIDKLSEKLAKDIEELAECMGIAVETPGLSLSPAISYGQLDDLSEKKQKEICAAIKDVSLLLGMLRALLEARDREEAIDIIFEALSILFSFESALLMLVDNNGHKLVGKRAFGTKQDDLAEKVIIQLDKDGSIWQEALTSKCIARSREFFRNHSYTIIDEQIGNLLKAKDFFVVPLIHSGEIFGVLALCAEKSWDESQESLLQVLAVHVAGALKTHNLRERLFEADRLNKTIVYHAPIGLISLDKDGRITRFNPMAKKVFEIPTVRSMTGLNICDVFDVQADILKERFAPLLSGRYQEIAPFEYRAPSGKTYWLCGKGVPLEDRDHLKGFLILMEDVTERILAEETMQNYAASLEERVKTKTRALEESQAQLLRAARLAATGRLARRVAHEVNNPLGIIRNYLQIMSLKMPEDDPKKESMRIIDEEISRIASIIQQLVDFSRAEMVNLQRLDINNLLQDLVKIMRESYQEQGVTMILDLSESPAYANVDIDKIKQVFINLIKNAVEAMPGGGEIRLATRLREKKDGRNLVAVEVADTGAGIPEDVKKHIFEPFYSSKGLSNSGLGLSVSYGIIKASGGDIAVESAVGKGATFTVFLPAG
jgi:PAS domain S-box-containing protein/putative nucleotidyltransferase with HDIG domain